MMIFEQYKTVAINNNSGRVAMNEILYKFNQKVINNPLDIAIECEHDSITFKDIDIESEKIKNFLLTGNFTEIIGVHVRDELRYLEILLGIFKAGKIFFPLNIQLSQNKIFEKIDFHDINCVLTDNINIVDHSIFFDINNIKVISNKIHANINFNEIAYVLPTSGTTGSPKSVIVGHDNLHWILNNYYNTISFTKGDKFLFTSSYTFDLFFSEILAPIYGDGHLFISTEYSQKELIINLGRIINRHHITHISITPSMGKCAYPNIKEILFTLKYLIWVGEKLENPLFNDFSRKTNIYCKFYNMYGPTETTIYCTYQELFKNDTLLPIGQAFKGCNLLIMDENGHIAEEGELLIGGKGLSRGYIKNPSLNNDKFVTIEDQTYFKSGDLVKREKNILIYKGRLDNQIKINGARIELDEINEIVSNTLKSNNTSSSYYSLTVHNNKIVLFIQCRSSTEIYFLEKTFCNYPEYMRPLIIPVENFIYNINGKLDIKKMLNYNKLTSLYTKKVLSDLLNQEFQCVSIKELDSLRKAIFICMIEEKFNVKLNFCNIWDDLSLEKEFNNQICKKEKNL